MMKRIAAVLAGAALAGGGVAAAHSDTVGSRPKASSESKQGTGKVKAGTETSSGKATGVGTGGSGQATGTATGTTGAATQGQAQTAGSLQGTVVKSPSTERLYIQHMGAVIPVEISKSTTLLGLSGKKLTDLREGDQVTVSFQVRNGTQNVATSVQFTGTGGSGFEKGYQKGSKEQYPGMGTHEKSRKQGGTGGSGSAGTTAPGEDSDVGKTSVPDRDPMSHPRDVNNPPVTTDDKPIY